MKYENGVLWCEQQEGNLKIKEIINSKYHRGVAKGEGT